MTVTLTPTEKTELEAGYAHDQRRYADEEVIDKYDTKGNYSHSEYLEPNHKTWKSN